MSEWREREKVSDRKREGDRNVSWKRDRLEDRERERQRQRERDRDRERETDYFRFACTESPSVHVRLPSAVYPGP